MEKTQGSKKKRRVWIVVAAIVVVAVVVVIVVGALGAGRAQAIQAAPDTVTLARNGLEQVVATTGAVQSTSKREVSSSLSDEISEIYVEVGSVVAEGDALCRLDTDVEEDQLITAPIAGTVTAMTAELNQSAGGSGGSMTAMGTEAAATTGGSLFTIQDTGSLEVTATVPEYDMVSLSTGMPVTITSDALEDESWEGALESISPVAVDENGNFTVVASVTSAPGRLAVGMSAKMNIIVEEKQDIYAVPYDAVVENEAGEMVVYEYLAPASESAAQDAQTVQRREIVVETGMEADYYIEIIADELEDGLLILTDPEGRNVSDEPTGFSFPGMGA